MKSGMSSYILGRKACHAYLFAFVTWLRKSRCHVKSWIGCVSSRMVAAHRGSAMRTRMLRYKVLAPLIMHAHLNLLNLYRIQIDRDISPEMLRLALCTPLFDRLYPAANTTQLVFEDRGLQRTPTLASSMPSSTFLLLLIDTIKDNTARRGKNGP
jgi:hypothetical protein